MIPRFPFLFVREAALFSKLRPPGESQPCTFRNLRLRLGP